MNQTRTLTRTSQSHHKPLTQTHKPLVLPPAVQSVFREVYLEPVPPRSHHSQVKTIRISDTISRRGKRPESAHHLSDQPGAYEAAVLQRTVQAQREVDYINLYHSKEDYFSKLTDTKHENTQLEKDNLAHSEVLFRKNRKIQALLEEQTRLTASLRDSRRKNDERNISLKEAQNEITLLKAENERFKSLNTKLSNHDLLQTKQISTYQDEIKELWHKNEEISISHDTMKSTYDEMSRNYHRIETMKTTTDNNLQKITDQYHDLKIQFMNLKNAHHKLTTANTGLIATHEMTVEQVQFYLQDNEELRLAKQDMISKNAAMERSLQVTISNP